MKLNRIILLVQTFILICLSATEAQKTDVPFIKYMNHPWVDSVLNTLTVDQRIAQLIWIAGYSDRSVAHEVEVTEIIKKYGPGGIIFFQGTAEKQAELSDFYQSVSGVPLIYAMDAEWGPGMRLTNVEKFPYQMTLGAIRNDSLIYLMGQAVATQFKRIGIHVNLAPVADINNNPRNPVINYRSFGENPKNVSSKSLMYMHGLQNNGILATIKHFPGHGDTDVDSHSDLPVLKHTAQRLDSIELYPFMNLINQGAGSVMTAHLNLPALDSTRNLPASLSPVVIKELLIKKMGFDGLIITDAMNMQGVTKYFRQGEAEAMAFEAGNDVVEFVADVDAVISETKKMIASKRITPDEIDTRCRKVLALKYWAGLNKTTKVRKENISEDLNTGEIKALIRDLYASALTLLNNNDNILPLRKPEDLKIASLAINKKEATQFQKRIGKYQHSDNYSIDPSDLKAVDDLMAKLKNYDIVITGVYGITQRPDRGFGLTPALTVLLDRLIENNKCIITWFGNPYAVEKIASLRNSHALLLSYQENEYTEDLSAQLIFGGIGARGSLPVTINDKWQCGHGISTPGNIRMQFGFPENAGMSSVLEKRIDSIVNIGLERKAFPGCEVMASRHGMVVFSKCYGFHTYEKRIAVREDDVYDLASVTKVAAATPGLMLLETAGKFNPETSLGEYIPFFRRSDKGDIRMAEILTHQAGLTAWIPFWKETIKKNGDYKKSVYRYRSTNKYPLEVAQGLYITDRYNSKIYREIRRSPLGEKKYLYSDLGLIITPLIIERLTGEKWHEYVTDNIYHKIGAFDIAFNPWNKYQPERIVPTEYDSLFRKQLLQGTVHDEGAAMLGGISGHAGAFATAVDLMKLLELYRRLGSYGGEQIIGSDVLRKYTSVQYPENKNRRGLGFDKPLLNNSDLSLKDAYPAKSASASSFGHSGYTGTFVWVDPEYDICYIFLSNRVYPTRENNLLSELNIRSDILQALYDSVKK